MNEKHNYAKNNLIIDTIDKTTLFWYIVLFCFILFVFSKLTIKLNIILGFSIGIILILYLYRDYDATKIKSDEESELKKTLIIPKPLYAIEHDEIIDYLFSIQDLYIYNPREYEDLIEHLDQFFLIYNEINVNNELVIANYETLVNIKRSTLNSLQSILNMVLYVERDNKLNKAVENLNILLNIYLTKVKKIHDNYIYTHGYDKNTKLIHTGPIPYNTYENTPYTFDIY